MSPPLAPVLAADDEATDAYILRFAFERAQVANPLIVVTDGQEVVNYLTGVGRYCDRAAYPLPVLLTLDLKMPRMSGFDVLAWLQERPEFKGLPAIVISSSSEAADIARARSLGARDYFEKPIGLEDFVEIARTVRNRWLVPGAT